MSKCATRGGRRENPLSKRSKILLDRKKERKIVRYVASDRRVPMLSLYIMKYMNSKKYLI